MSSAAGMDRILGRGVELLRKDGSVAADVPATARVVGLFFASRNMETSAAAARVAEVCAKTLARGKVLHVVYVPLDDDDEARSAMPDLFVALTQPGVRDRLWADLQLTASPSLVLFEGDTGRLITKNGMRVIREDPEGLKYPWVPQTLDALLGDTLVQGSGKQANRREALAGKHVGLLFAAQWSLPSLKLLEKLYVAYKSIRQRRSGLLAARFPAHAHAHSLQAGRSSSPRRRPDAHPSLCRFRDRAGISRQNTRGVRKDRENAAGHVVCKALQK